MVTADRSSFIDEAFLCRHQYYLCKKLSHVGYGLFRYVCSLAPSTGNVASSSPIGFIRFSFAVEFALRGYLTNEAVADSIFMKRLKECLFEKFEHYFDNEVEKDQKDSSLVSAILLCHTSADSDSVRSRRYMPLIRVASQRDTFSETVMNRCLLRRIERHSEVGFRCLDCGVSRTQRLHSPTQPRWRITQSNCSVEGSDGTRKPSAKSASSRPSEWQR